MTEIGVIVSGLGVAKAVAEFMGLIESLGAKIDKLSRSELASGLRNLDQARSSAGEAKSLIREARNCFNKAIALESGYRLGIAHLGLALCHSQLNDKKNCLKSLEELLHLTPVPSFYKEFIAKDMVDKQGASWWEVLTKSGAVHDLLRLGSVVARRANFAPDSIRRLVQPTKEELILGIGMDPDAGRLTKLQLLISDHLGESVGWMDSYKISREELRLESQA